MGSEDYRSPWQKKREAKRREEVDNLKPANNPESIEPVTRWPRSSAPSPYAVARGRRKNISIYFVVILAVAVMTVVLVYLRGESKARVASDFQQKVRAESLATTLEISKYSEQCIESVERFARNLAEAQTRNTALEFAKIATRDEKRKEARRDLQPDVTAVRFAFLHDAFDRNDAKFADRDGYGKTGRMVAAFVLRGLEWQREANSDMEGNLPDEPWYRDVMSTRTKHFSYARSKAGSPVFSWSTPILRNGRFAGVACIEYSHGAMKHILLEYAPGVDRKRAPMFTWVPLVRLYRLSTAQLSSL